MIEKAMKLLGAWAALAAMCLATTVTGTIKYPNGATFTGSLTFTLAASGGSGGAVLVPGVTVKVVAGSLPANFLLAGNDTISPSGTYYAVKYYDHYGNLVMTNNYVITGSTYDLGQSVPTPVTTNHINYLDLLGLRSASIIGTSGSTIPLTITGAAGQTANLLELDSGGATLAAISPTGQLLARSIELVQYSDLHDFASQTPGGSLAGGATATITPGWSAIPPGVESGGGSIVSESSGSPVITWVSGDKFNPLWAAGKTVNIDATITTIISCADSTHCTLAANAPRTSSHGWAVIGHPTPIYISGGTGAAESVDVSGIGSECAGGSAVSVCLTPANSHGGAWTMSSATAGAQEAVNVAEDAGGGAVRLPGTPVTWYGPVLIGSNGIRLYGASQSSPEITFTPAASYSGSLASVVTVLNASQDALEDFYVHGPSGTGWNDVGLVCTTGSGGCSQNDATQLLLDGATGTVTDPAGGGPYNAAGLMSFGVDGVVAKNVRSIFNADGYFAENGGNGSGSRSMILGGDYSSNSGDGIHFQGGFLQSYFIGAGAAIFNNIGAGISLDRENGTEISAAHFERNNPDILVAATGTQGLSVHGNLISQRNDSTATCFICQTGPATGPVSGTIEANYFSLDDTGSGSLNETSLVDVQGTGLQIGANAEQSDTARSLSMTNEYKLEAGTITSSVASAFRDPSWSGKITVTNPVNDVANSWTGFWPWRTTANDTPLNLVGNGALEIDSDGTHGAALWQDSTNFHISTKGQAANYFYCAFSSQQCHAAQLFTADAGLNVTGTMNATTVEQGSQAVALVGANGISAGKITLVAGTGSHTFGTAYSVAPVCTATDTTGALVVQVTSSTTAVTIAGTGTDVIAWICATAAN